MNRLLMNFFLKIIFFFFLIIIIYYLKTLKQLKFSMEEGVRNLTNIKLIHRRTDVDFFSEIDQDFLGKILFNNIFSKISCYIIKIFKNILI